MNFAKAIGLFESTEKHLNIRENTQVWKDKQIVNAIVLLNIAGGSKVSDLKILEADAGFCEILQKAAFIPAPNNNLLNLQKIDQDMISAMQVQSSKSVVAIDMDAALVETNKRDAMYSYKGFKAYHHLWEQGFQILLRKAVLAVESSEWKPLYKTINDLKIKTAPE